MTNHHSTLIRSIPFIFVFLWSTGFIGAKYTLPYVETFNLLFIRMAATVIVFGLLMLALKVPMPKPTAYKHQIISGLLIHGAYLGGVFAAIKWQMPAGLTALLVSMQPLLTALIAASIYRQTMARAQWFGLALGLFGVLLVLLSKNQSLDLNLNWQMLLAALTALLGITIGSIYQKRHAGDTHLVAASFIQYLATMILMAGLTFSFETQAIDWQWPLIGGLIWLVFGLSVTAILLLLYMIKHGESAKVASYFYLVPGLTAIEAWVLFNETLPPIAVCGFIVSIAGVYLTISVNSK